MSFRDRFDPSIWRLREPDEFEEQVEEIEETVERGYYQTVRDNRSHAESLLRQAERIQWALSKAGPYRIHKMFAWLDGQELILDEPASVVDGVCSAETITIRGRLEYRTDLDVQGQRWRHQLIWHPFKSDPNYQVIHDRLGDHWETDLTLSEKLWTEYLPDQLEVPAWLGGE